MKRQLLLLFTIFTILFFVGGVCATEADISNTSANNDEVPITEGEPISGEPSEKLSEEKQSNIVKTDVEINYKYNDDSNINPEIELFKNNVKINYIKTQNNNKYHLEFNDSNANDGDNYDLLISVPGYNSVNQTLTLNSLYATASINLNATGAYVLGHTISEDADQRLDFANADEILAITTAGTPKYNGKTSEDVIEAILNYAKGKISYGQGNILMLRQTAVDPISVAFIVRKGADLIAAIYSNASLTPTYLGTISETMSRAQWNDYVTKVGSEDGYSFASLANAWAAGASNDILREAAFHGHVCDGTLGGYSVVKALLEYYPPIQETANPGSSVADKSSYKILGVPGGSIDDAVIYYLDATPGKSGYAGFNTTSTGATEDMVGFIRWSGSTGDIIVMSFKNSELKNQFLSENGLSEMTGSLEELKYNTWWINKINTDPLSLVKVICAYSNLTEEQYYYLVGTASDVTAANGSTIPAQEAHGLDLNYIQNLGLPSAAQSSSKAATDSLTYDDMKEIGVKAAQKAKEIFESHGITIEKDDPDFGVFTSAGYALLNGQTTEATWDGIESVFGSRLSRSTLMPIHVGLWKTLWFSFVLRNGTVLNTVYLRYNDSSKDFVVNIVNDEDMNDIGIDAINNNPKYSALAPDHSGMATIANAWAYEPPFDQLITFLFHDHACPGVQPGFFLTEYIQENYPLNSAESYYYQGASIYCKDDSLIYLLGISPGMGSYANQRLTDEDTESGDDYLPGGTDEGLLVIWDSATNTGRATIVSYKWPTYNLTGYSTSSAKRYAQIASFVQLYKGEKTLLPVLDDMGIYSSEVKYITADEYAILTQGGTKDTNSLEYLRNVIPQRTLAETIALQKPNIQPGNQKINPFDTQKTESTTSTSKTNSNATGKKKSTAKVKVANGSKTKDSGSDSSNNDGSNSEGSNSKTSNGKTRNTATSSSSNDVGETSSVKPAEVSAASVETPENTEPEDTADESSDSSATKAYEVSENKPTSSGNSNNIIYVVVGVLAVAGLGIYGFMKGGLGKV